MGNIERVKWILNASHRLGIQKEEEPKFILFTFILCDQIWCSRNKKFFENEPVSPNILASQISTRYLTHLFAWSLEEEKNSSCSRWSPPLQEWIKVNFDVAVKENASFASIVARSQDGNIIQAWKEKFPPSSPLWAEANAALLTIKSCAELNFNNVIFEGDALMVIDAINSKSCDELWEISS